MAAYAYKSVAFRDDFKAAREEFLAAECSTAADYDDSCGYDGYYWYVVAYLLEKKDRRIAELEEKLAEVGP